MNDKEKLSLIDRIVCDAWEWNKADEGFYEGILCAVGSVVGFREDEE